MDRLNAVLKDKNTNDFETNTTFIIHFCNYDSLFMYI